MSRFLGSKPRSECLTELGQMGLRRGECVCTEVCEGVRAGLQVGNGVEVLPTENLACTLLRQKEKQEFIIMMIFIVTSY